MHLQEMNRGGEETVLLIHGMFTNLSIFYFNIAPVLARNFHVVMYDMKGHGMSTMATHGYGLNAMSDDLLNLMDALQIPDAHLAGYSYGGLVALNTAIRFPDKIKKLAVIESPDPKGQEGADIFNMYSRELLESFIRSKPGDIGNKISKRQLERRHKMYEFFLHETSLERDMRQERDFFTAKEIHGIPHETLLIYGRDSDCVSSGRRLRERIARSRLVMLPGDHSLPLQEPAPIARELEAFFSPVLAVVSRAESDA